MRRNCLACQSDEGAIVQPNTAYDHNNSTKKHSSNGDNFSNKSIARERLYGNATLGTTVQLVYHELVHLSN